MKFVALHDGEPMEVEVERHGAGYRVRLDQEWLEVDLVNAGRFVRSLRLADGTQFSLLHHHEGRRHDISFPGSTVQVEIVDPLSLRRTSREDEGSSGGVVRAMMPGRVVRLLVNQGDAVRRGQGLLILEAMKMENEITAPIDGTLAEVLVEAGQTVESGAELLRIG